MLAYDVWRGRYSGSRVRPKTLQVVDVPIIDNRQCEDWHSSKGINVIIYDEMMCAGYRNGGKDSCQVRTFELSDLYIFWYRIEMSIKNKNLSRWTGRFGWSVDAATKRTLGISRNRLGRLFVRAKRPTGYLPSSILHDWLDITHRFLLKKQKKNNKNITSPQ